MSAWLGEMFGMGREPAAEARWIIVDCETSGLEPSRDSLISLAAVAVKAQRIVPSDCFSTMLRQEQTSGRENILVHGIGKERQSSGAAPTGALSAFLAFAGDSPRVAYRAAFDQAFIRRAAQRARRRDRGSWLDLAQLLPVAFPQLGNREATLDAWLSVFGIAHGLRHDALGDAYATAQLFQVALAEALRQGFSTVGAVLRAARAGRWTPA
ncbi:MAG TPA: 3'-5' exonuclease [Burkholderiales bacterium]